MKYQIREIDKESFKELKLVTERCMETVLETIPEFQGDTTIAKESLSNFSFEQMSNMIQKDFTDPNKRIMVAVAGDELIGHAIYSVKKDDDNVLYGFCYSRYVEPSYRRQGVASMLMENAIEWFRQEKVSYLYAQTHITNIKLQGLFKKFGFVLSGPFKGRWEYYILKKDME